MKRDDAFDLDREKKAWLRPWLLERRERERESKSKNLQVACALKLINKRLEK